MRNHLREKLKKKQAQQAQQAQPVPGHEQADISQQLPNVDQGHAPDHNVQEASENQTNNN